MNPQYDIYQLIDRYLAKSLSGDELTQFLQRLETDETLRETLEAQQMAHALILDNEMIQLKERMRKEMNEGPSGLSTGSKIILTSLLALSIGTISYFFFSQDSDQESSDVVETVKSNPTETVSPIESIAPASTESIQISDGVVDKKNPIVKTETITTPENTKAFTPSEVYSTPDTKKVEEQPNNISTPAPDVSQKKNSTDCANVSIDASTRIEYGFSGTEASILIDKNSIKGGTSPYLFSLDNILFTSTPKFDELQEGNYNVYIKDLSNCIAVLKKILTVKYKIKDLDEAFNPNRGEKWNFPLKGNSDASITIQNKAGMVVYSANVTNGYPSDWDGRDNRGAELETGNYFFIVNFNNNEFVKGHISIFR